MQQDFGLKKLLHIFAVIVFVIAVALAIALGILTGKEIVTDGTTVKETWNFGKFLLEFIKWIGFGLFGSGVLLALADRCL